jgi:hypothetical protein
MDALRPLSSAQRELYLSTRPAMPAPDGVTPNFDNPPNSNQIVVAAMTLGVSGVICTATLRFYATAVVTRRLKVEDCMLSLSTCRIFH